MYMYSAFTCTLRCMYVVRALYIVYQLVCGITCVGIHVHVHVLHVIYTCIHVHCRYYTKLFFMTERNTNLKSN